MNFLNRLLGLLRPAPKTPEDIAAAHEAARLQAEQETNRLSQRSAAGSLDYSGRGRSPR